MSDKLDRVIKAARLWRETRKQGTMEDVEVATEILARAVDDAVLIPGEMTFTVRSKDRVSARTIKAWMTFAEQEHAPDKNLNEVRIKLTEWEKWQNDTANSVYLKVPD